MKFFYAILLAIFTTSFLLVLTFKNEIEIKATETTTDTWSAPSEEPIPELRGSGDIEPQRESDNQGETKPEDIEPVHHKETLTVKITTYNPEVAQTDSSPCIGAIGADVCELYDLGYNPIALSQDLLYGTRGHYCKADCAFHYYDKIEITSDIPQCNLTGVVVDTMNSRFTNSADIFKADRAMNTSCVGEIKNLTR